LIDKLKKSKWMVKLIGDTSMSEKKRLIGAFTSGSKKYHKSIGSNVDMKELLKCALCPNMCRFECPTLSVTRKDTYAPATKARISYHMEKGHIPMSDLKIAEVAYMCQNCNGCLQWCPMDISTGELLKKVRADLAEQGVYIPFIKEFKDKMEAINTVFNEKTYSSDTTLNVNRENPEVFYFMGCVTAEKKPESAKATISILEKAGIKFCTHTDNRHCCGGPAYTLGFLDTFKEFAKYNISMFTNSGMFIKVISDCPACVYAINKYKEVGLKHTFEVMTTTQYFKQLIEEGKLKLENEVNFSITYHDPCFTARSLEKQDSLLNDPVNINKKEYDNAARWIFSRIPSLELKEVFLHGKETQCCGRGGVSHIHHPEVSDAIGRERVKQLKATGADKIASACPSCEEGLIFNGAGECLDISEIILMAISEK
jgi:Fe-S oxidoreductase